MIIIVDKRAEIPHYVGSLCFNPFCETNEVKGKTLIKSAPKFYSEISIEESQSIDSSLWKKVDVFRGKTLQQIVASLSKEQGGKVLEFLQELLYPRPTPEKKTVPVEIPQIEKGLPEMTIVELKKLAEDKGMEIPYNVVKKSDILAFIQSKINAE